MKIHRSAHISRNEPYAFAEVDKQVAALKAQGIKVIDFGVGDPTSPTPEFVIEAMCLAAKNHARAGYPSYIGSEAFRESASQYLQQGFGVSLDPATEITSTIGSKEAVFHFPLCSIDPGDVVIVPTPGYPPYKTGTLFAGGVPYYVPLLAENNFLIDIDAIPEDVCKKAKIIWINYPNSPTGALATSHWYEQLITWAHANDIIIAADEGCYIDIYFDQKPMSILQIEREGIITFYSLSKRNNMTGYRVGFAAGDAVLIESLKHIKTHIDSGTPNFIQDAASVALRDTEHAKQMREEYRQKMETLLPALEAYGLPACCSDATFYIWQRAPDGMTGADLAEELLALGIVVTPGIQITDTTEHGINPGEHYVRFALIPTAEEIIEAARRLQSKSV